MTTDISHIKHHYVAKILSGIIVSMFMFYVYASNVEVNSEIDKRKSHEAGSSWIMTNVFGSVWTAINSIFTSDINKKPTQKLNELGILQSPFLDKFIGQEIVGVRWFGDDHKGVDYALIETIDYGEQVKLQAVSRGTLYYGTWKAPEDTSLINWVRKDYGGWGRFALLYADNGYIYLYAHMEAVNKDLKNPDVDKIQKEVTRVLFPEKIWKATIWFNFDRDITIYKGTHVNPGDYIGDMGNFGFVNGVDRGDITKTGKHLHLQVFEKTIKDTCYKGKCDNIYTSIDPLTQGFYYNENEQEAIKKYQDKLDKEKK